jgi:hypothetical protein
MPIPEPGPRPGPGPEPTVSTRTLRLVGTVPPEMWNRLGTKILPKLRSGLEVKIGLEFIFVKFFRSSASPCFGFSAMKRL